MSLVEVPAKSRFEQVHRASEFGALNLAKSPAVSTGRCNTI